MNRAACSARFIRPQGKLSLVLMAGFGLLSLGGLTADQVRAATASTRATVIAPASVMRSWADWPVTVSLSGGWVRLVIPAAAPPPLVSSLSNPLNDGDLVVRVTPSGDAAAADVRGEFATSLSLLAPQNDGRYRVTVAFN